MESINIEIKVTDSIGGLTVEQLYKLLEKRGARRMLNYELSEAIKRVVSAFSGYELPCNVSGVVKQP